MKKSKLGYKRYSPDVRKPFNVIPSGRITMQDVDFPVFGVDDMGNAQIMYPGGEYEFPGSQVFELPIRQAGGQRDTIYTSNPNDPRLKAYQDSLYVRASNSQTFTPGNRTRPLTPDEKIFWKDEKTGLVPNLVEYNPANPTWGYFGHYKKPVQPVEYKRNEKVNIAPKERSMPEPSIKINRTVKFPEVITGVKYDIQKGDVMVGLTGKDVTMSREEFTTWVNKPENRKMFNDYRTQASAKKLVYGGEKLPMAQKGLNIPAPYLKPSFTNYIQKPQPIALASGRIEPSNIDFQIAGGIGAGLAKAAAMKKAIWLPKRPKPSSTRSFMEGFGMGMLNPLQEGGVPQISPSLAAYLQRPEQIAKARATQGERLTFEGKINKALGDPKEKAAELAHYADTEGEGPVDNIRHTSAGMYTADAIANMLSPMQVGPAAIPAKIAGFAGSNLAGLAHELKAFIPSLQGDYKNIPAAARMTAEDMVNNFVGSALALNPLMSQKEKEDLIIRLSDQNYLPDGYEKIGNEGAEDLYVKKQYGGDLEEFGSGGLKQWFAEKWVDVKTGKECGRSGKDKDGRPYPACRPSRRVNSTTPKTTSEMSSSEKAKFKREKTSGQRIDYNHKRAQEGGMMQDTPEMTNLEGMFDYWLNNYDNGKSLKTQSKEQAFEAFKNAYLKAVIEN